MRVSEVYASVQGEGPRVGRTTVFVRFGGCNLRCPGWPCDTQHAIDPAFRSDWERLTPDQLFERVRSTADVAGASLITLTGGEPFLQVDSDLERLCVRLRHAGFELEAFTNGTIRYPEWATETVQMIVDWKLHGSGESSTLIQKRLENLEALNLSSLIHAVKFVCKDERDFHQATSLWSVYKHKWEHAFEWYYGKVWDGDITDAELAGLVMKARLPWKMNVQLHNYIWDPQERGR